MTRPRGEIRAVLAAQFAEQGAATWRQVLPQVMHSAGADARSPAEVRLVRMTVQNMVAAGELVRVGAAKAAGSRVWHALYEPAAAMADATGSGDVPAPGTGAAGDDGAAVLTAAIRSWADFI